MDPLLIIALVVVGIFLLWLAFRIIRAAIAVAIALFVWAAESGFIGVAIYVAAWVFAFPVMLPVCLIGGVIALIFGWWWLPDPVNSRRDERLPIAQARKGHPTPGDPDYYDWANRTARYKQRKAGDAE